MEDLFSMCVFLAFPILFIWMTSLEKKELSYLLNPKNEREIVKQTYYDASCRKDYLKKLRKMQSELRAEEKLNRTKKTIFIRLYPSNTDLQYVERLIEKITNDFYVNELKKMTEKEQRLDNWDQF
ncbi:hypothetical protein [Candidatus Enterococcus mansonii]|uniref:Uncharacterized protein n=1 Tax=Candidatus Enterococcus mansonii TaxID=1834181 RepID=A0A2C9XFI5_9ENTE|nr:hypothetical protein [Enterococcus sp. 4G2_DIV0659]OTO02775.1 hypothetical protein A5880_003171 [Enterococcus sp. 4G2_DIV0659]